MTTTQLPQPIPQPQLMPRPRPTKLDGFQEVETQPLWFRMITAGGAVVAPLSRIDFFNVRKNAQPHLTNCEEANSMPNTSGFKIAGIELVPNGVCNAVAFRKLINHCRLVIEVGTKGIEKVNQPAAFFGSSVNTGAVDNTATVKPGIYKLNPGEEITLEPDQPYLVYLAVDSTGFTLAADENLDFIIRFWGQKRGRVSLG